jgi:hypothetical protein
MLAAMFGKTTLPVLPAPKVTQTVQKSGDKSSEPSAKGRHRGKGKNNASAPALDLGPDTATANMTPAPHTLDRHLQPTGTCNIRAYGTQAPLDDDSMMDGVQRPTPHTSSSVGGSGTATLSNSATAPKRRKQRAEDEDHTGRDRSLESARSGASTPLGADMFNQQRPARAATRAQRSAQAPTRDWDQDHRLGKKTLSENAVTDLLGTIGSFVMSQALMIKVLASIAIFRTEIDSGGEMQLDAKSKTKDFHDHIQLIPKHERKATLPPYLLVADSCFTIGKKIALEDYDSEHAVHRAFAAYSDYLDQLDPPARAAALMEDWRYARFRTTHTASRSLLEIGVSPIASQYARPALKALIQLVTDKYNGVPKAGIAPKTRQEQRIEAALRAMGAWRN